jgi:DNA repair exonuclease SbcCD ATPase subunit
MQSEINELKIQINSLKSSLDSLNGKIDFIKESINKTSLHYEELIKQELSYSKAVELLTIVQKLTREKTCSEFETIVTYALQYIFNKDYQFKLEFGKRGNLPELDFKLKVPECEETIGICDASGGGVVDIASLALRLVLMEISKNKGVLVLDETLKHLSEGYRPAAYEFLKEINKKLKKQIIFVTHSKELIDASDYKIKIGD